MEVGANSLKQGNSHLALTGRSAKMTVTLRIGITARNK
jgi:hypothetical protein